MVKHCNENCIILSKTSQQYIIPMFLFDVFFSFQDYWGRVNKVCEELYHSILIIVISAVKDYTKINIEKKTIKRLKCLKITYNNSIVS